MKQESCDPPDALVRLTPPNAPNTVGGIALRYTPYLLASVLAAALIVIPSEPAHAWTRLYCKFHHDAVKFKVTTNAAPTTSFTDAANAWEVGTSGVTLQRVTSGSHNLKVRTVYLGDTGWSGKLHDQGAVDDPADCVDGHWQYGEITITVNNRYNGGNQARRRKGVAIHEFGHFLGLGHNNLTASCPGGGADYLTIMFPSDARFDGNCAAFLPRADDKTGINALH